MRLNRYLSQCGVCSRREADRLIGAGRVLVNGRPAGLGMDVTEGDLVEADGRPVKAETSEIFLAVNKPRGYVVTTDRSHGDRLIGDLIHKEERVFSVGRLDKESEGLILMTNNGDVSNRIQKARGFHEKEYQVTIDRPVTEELIRGLSSGVWLEELGRRTRPCRVRKTGEHSMDMVLTEGMNRQIRRMCAAFGCQVTRLRRIRVMNVLLGDLKPGEYRDLTDTEVRELKRSLGTAGGEDNGDGK